MNTTYTTQDLGAIQLGNTTYQIEEATYPETGGAMTFLYGPRGAAYFLREYSNRPGHFQVISAMSGKELRKRGNEVTVIRIGDLIEEYNSYESGQAEMAARASRS
jgi:hypothetical protein